MRDNQNPLRSSSSSSNNSVLPSILGEDSGLQSGGHIRGAAGKAGVLQAHKVMSQRDSRGMRRGMKTRNEREIMLKITTMSRSRGYIDEREEVAKERWGV
jgi:hypothetical protein